jgi:predicted enzyme involved in methoxymalonyl-ACP biosynthesis
MSCRVLKRGVELLEFERLLAFCRAHSIKRVRGCYLPTPKNKLVEDHYAKLGFRAVSDHGQGTAWAFNVSEAPALEHYIKIRGD